MSEATFAKQFLATLDSKPQKLSSDHVANPKHLPAQPAFVLPRMSKPFPKASEPSQASSTGDFSSNQLNVTLSPLRKTGDSPAPIKIAVQPKSSIYDMKTQLGAQTGYASDKLKILWERKPVPDSKTLQEVVGKQAGDVDLLVMYTGSPTAAPKTSGETANTSAPPSASATTAEKKDVDETPVAQGKSGEAVLEDPSFWADLQDFVLQRVRDETISKEATGLFQKAWTSR